MKVCKNCGEINQSDVEFCCNCGKSAFVFSEEVTCPHCGAANDKSFTHCINCGNLLEEKTSLPLPSEIGGGMDMSLAVDLRGELSEVYNSSLTDVSQKETVKCPSCGTEIQINSIFCYKCGAPVSKLHEHRVVRRKVCPHCGRPNLPSSPYCTYCYCSLADAHSEDYQLVHESKQVGKAVIKQAFLQDAAGKLKICNNCGTLNAPEELFCVNCGLKLDMEEQKLYCVNCGAENEPETKFCTKCRWSFEGRSPDTAEGVWTCRLCNHTNEKEDGYCPNCGAKRD